MRMSLRYLGLLRRNMEAGLFQCMVGLMLLATGCTSLAPEEAEAEGRAKREREQARLGRIYGTRIWDRDELPGPNPHWIMR